jgi:Skp family chaperone for outer membrane proteins
MFYDSLNPHGRWLNVDGYGYAFSPRIGSRSSWRPYVDGRWVSTSQGWAWDSNEPFGWACYHYGRWTRIARHGWVWIPGRQWAPSWVSWRYGSDSVGWAPLPPSVGYGSIGHDCDARYGIAPTSYTFIRATNFGRSSYVNVSLSITNITQIFHQTINVTNIVQIRQQQNNLFVQRGGPALDWVEKRCGERIERAPIQVVHTLERPGERRPGHSDHGFIAAPLPSGRANRPTELPRNAERVIAPTVVDAWTEVPADQRDNLRKAITEQATEAQPKPVLAVTDPIIVEPVREAPAQPTIPAPTVAEVPGRGPGRDRGKGDAPAMPQLEIAQDAANKADLARRDAERQMQEAQAEREKQLAEQKAAESAMVAQQENLAKKQAEAIAMQEQLAEQAKKDAAMREKQASEMSEKEAAALKEKQASEMAAQQEELAKKQAEAVAMQQQIAEQEKYDLILQEVIFASSRVDITEKVIRQLNAPTPAAAAGK